MFDFGFSELLVIAVVALVVIGPERLPTVAHTVGALLGRLNRYVADVKSDVEREMRLDEMKKLRAEVEQQAMGIEQSVVRELESTRTAVAAPAAELQQSLADVMHETGQTGIDLQSAPAAPAARAEAVVDNSQKNPGNATLTSADLAARPPSPSAPQATLDFDAVKDALPNATAAPAVNQTTAKT